MSHFEGTRGEKTQILRTQDIFFHLLKVLMIQTQPQSTLLNLYLIRSDPWKKKLGWLLNNKKKLFVGKKDCLKNWERHFLSAVLTALNMTLKVTSYIFVFSVKNLILPKELHHHFHDFFAVFSLVFMSKTKHKDSSNHCW